MAKRYVYRLNVTIPPECSTPGYEPQVLIDQHERQGWSPSEEQGFRWPMRRNYLSVESAHRRAQLLASWGATVTIDRMPFGEPERMPCTYTPSGIEVAV